MKRRNTIKTRFKYIEKIHGFCIGELAIVAGRPGVGKTSFITNIIEDALFFKNQKKNVLLFSLELKIGDACGNDSLALKRSWVKGATG